MGQGRSRDWLEMDRRTFMAALTMVIVVAMVAALYLLVVSRTASQGRRIQSLRRSLADVERSNAHAEIRIARAASAHALLSRAIDLGLAPATFDQLWFVRTSDRTIAGAEGASR